MLPTLKNRRGMTLAEIMVCLGVVAIMIVMAVSFVLLLSDRTRTANENTSAHQDLTLIQSGVEAWFNGVTEADLKDDSLVYRFDPDYTLDFATILNDPTLNDSTAKVVLTNEAGESWVYTQDGENWVNEADKTEICGGAFVEYDVDTKILTVKYSFSYEVEKKDDDGNVVTDDNGIPVKEPVIEYRAYNVSMDSMNGWLNELVEVEYEEEDGTTGTKWDENALETQPQYTVTITYTTAQTDYPSLTAYAYVGDTAVDNGTGNRLSFSYGTLSMNGASIHTETVNGLKFTVMGRNTVVLTPGEVNTTEVTVEPEVEGGEQTTKTVQTDRDVNVLQGVDYLYFCTVYREGEAPHTFTVNPRVGETAAGTVMVQINTEETQPEGGT